MVLKNKICASIGLGLLCSSAIVDNSAIAKSSHSKMNRDLDKIVHETTKKMLHSMRSRKSKNLGTYLQGDHNIKVVNSEDYMLAMTDYSGISKDRIVQAQSIIETSMHNYLVKNPSAIGIFVIHAPKPSTPLLMNDKELKDDELLINMSSFSTRKNTIKSIANLDNARFISMHYLPDPEGGWSEAYSKVLHDSKHMIDTKGTEEESAALGTGATYLIIHDNHLLAFDISAEQFKDRNEGTNFIINYGDPIHFTKSASNRIKFIGEKFIH
ncbi:hypothetical protein N9A04_00385 [Rickettsiales bacterium]|nr:hypothetical protein [Rickettsiales bacterium]